MDFFEELSKQAAKMLNNFSNTMNEFTNIASTSADSAANIVLLKGKLESLKIQLEKDYKEIGKAYVADPKADHEALVENAREKAAEIESINKKIDELKADIIAKGQQSRQVAVESAGQAVKDTKESLEEGVEKVKDFVDTRAKDAELSYDQALEDLESEDGVDSE